MSRAAIDEDTRTHRLLDAQDKAAQLFAEIERRGMVRAGVGERALSDEIRDLALHSASADRIMDTARAEGMRTLREDAFEKVKAGVTAIDEVLRVLGT